MTSVQNVMSAMAMSPLAVMSNPGLKSSDGRSTAFGTGGPTASGLGAMSPQSSMAAMTPQAMFQEGPMAQLMAMFSMMLMMMFQAMFGQQMGMPAEQEAGQPPQGDPASSGPQFATPFDQSLHGLNEAIQAAAPLDQRAQKPTVHSSGSPSVSQSPQQPDNVSLSNSGQYDPRFNEIIGDILATEGGYVNHPDDPGGETNFGITKRSYPHLDIKNLTKQQAADIYYRDYWLASGANKMPKGLDHAYVDAAINHGKGGAREILNRSDGTLQGFIGERRKKYQAIANNKPSSRKFLKGWMNRVDRVAKRYGVA